MIVQESPSGRTIRRAADFLCVSLSSLARSIRAAAIQIIL
jgi:hypothetical protein